MRQRMKPGLRKNRKLKLVLASILVMLTCAGYIFYTPKLINADDPFIDLSGSVGTAIGNAESAVEAGVHNDEQVARPTETPPQPTPVPYHREDSKESVTVRISDNVITINGIKAMDFDDFTLRITGAAFAGKQIELIDDYAELKTFRRAVRILGEYELPYFVTAED